MNAKEKAMEYLKDKILYSDYDGLRVPDNQVKQSDTYKAIDIAIEEVFKDEELVKIIKKSGYLLEFRKIQERHLPTLEKPKEHNSR